MLPVTASSRAGDDPRSRRQYRLVCDLFARLFPDAEVACVEPAEDNLRVLNKNLKLNKVPAVVIPAAVGVSDGYAFLEFRERDYGHRIVARPLCASRSAVEVEAISVPTILRRLSWERIGLLKVDIEGYEDPLFAHDCDWLDRVDAMCIEWHVNGGAERLATLAKRHGFSPPRQLPIWFLTRQAGALPKVMVEPLHSLASGGLRLSSDARA